MAAVARLAVLVTGASSGIGRCVVERLAAQGHRVFAGARKPADLQALRALTGVEALALDVTDARQVDAAAERVRELLAADADGPQGLHGLVNNAGIGGLGLLHTWSDDELRAILDTNIVGPLRTSRALLGLLLPARGRIVHIGSQGGSITSPAFGPYTATKHALEALAQCQHDELSPHGVQVSIVQPGGVATAIGENSGPGTVARWRRARPPFDAEATRALEARAQPADARAFRGDEPESPSNRRLSPPSLVAEAVEHALFAEVPRRRYLVGTRWEGDRVLSNLLERLLDANEGDTMGLTRDELVARLDRALDARRAAG